MKDEGGEAGRGGSAADACCATLELTSREGNCSVGEVTAGVFPARKGVGSAEGEKSRLCSGFVEDKPLEPLGSRTADSY